MVIKLKQVQKSGSAIPLALVTIMILLAVGVSLLSLGVSARIYSSRATHDIAAQCAADAGLAKALFEMNNNLNQYWDDENLPFTAHESLPGCLSIFDYTVTYDPVTGYTVQSTGKCGQKVRDVYATLRLQGPFDYAIAVQQNIVMKPGSMIEGYNFAEEVEKLQLATTSALPMQVILGKGALVDGDVAVGVGGNPDEVICAPEASITGNTYALTEEIEFPPVSVPQWLESLPSGGTLGGPLTITNSAKYDGISLGRGDVIVIDGPVTLYVTGTLGLSNSAQIQINQDNPNASLTLYLGGNINCKNGGAINNLTEDPTRLKLFGLDSCTNLNFAAAGQFYGGIYAPNAILNLKTSVELYGAFVANSFLQALAANVHYDAALKNAGPGDPGVRFAIKRWWE